MAKRERATAGRGAGEQRRGWLMVVWIAAVGLTAAMPAVGAEVVEVLPLTNRVIMLHFDEGHVEHHQVGQPRSQERVIVDPLDVEKASAAATYSVASSDDPAYAQPTRPTDVGRKSKGTNFAWFVDRMVDGYTLNDRPDHAKEHWVYLYLPEPMRRGKTYTLRTGDLNPKGSNEFPLTFDERRLRSEAVHVNLLGYVPDAPRKFGYVFHWAGDKGGLDLKRYAAAAFEVVDAKTGAAAFSGNLAFRKSADNPETLHATDSPPHGNYLAADVYETDFSPLKTPGEYRLVVDGIGGSFPFRIDPDVYRPAHRATMRGLYHNRSGIALTKPFTEHERPAPGHVKLTPGFADKLIYTALRELDWSGENPTKEQVLAHKKGNLTDTWGWYQDAGDWDGYRSHLNVPRQLLLAFALAPQNFRDGENNVPESSNGVPDILDEAAWLPRYGHRLRHELIRKGWGTGGVGLRVAGDPFGGDEATLPDGKKVGRGSWQDNDRVYFVSGEDPFATYAYAGVCAELARALRSIGKPDPEGVDWAAEAAEAYAWAKANTRDGDEQKLEANLRNHRAYASAALFRLTGDRAYERQLATDLADLKPDTALWWDRTDAPYLYAITRAAGPDGSVEPDPELARRVRATVLHNADLAVGVADRRALRWAGKWDMPMLIGQQTTPWAVELAVGYAIARDDNADAAGRYLATLYTTADYFLGANALNMTWITGVGPRYPTEIFHMDAWYRPGGYHEGMIPYSPWRKQNDRGRGPWDADWPNKTVYPEIDRWPGNERWFSNRCSPLASEFTIHQNTAPAAAFFGVLCAPGIAAEKRD